ncbi:MAG: NADP-dependent malic enzyme [Pseudomonadota bacterium]
MSAKEDLYASALRYHREGVAGKIAITPTKPLASQRDLSLAYSPGVAAACLAIKDDPQEAASLTARGNLVAVVTNGTAVLGLGDIGPLAAKPVMEGKAVLFKKFAQVDAIDLEVAETDIERFCDAVAALEPSFGAINLEDIKGPDCFAIEAALRQRMKIPVFHDDQHGTAIVAAAALKAALKLTGRRFDAIKLVSTGGGAAGIACLDLLVDLGVKRENIVLIDIHGVVHDGRAEGMNPHKARYATTGTVRSLAQAIAGADVFLGLSAPNVLTPAHLKAMADKPIILALANPEPEIDPGLARAARPDAMIATGRSDYPNQVNNVLCFPFIFRGALDVGATAINREMEIACVDALTRLTEAEASEVVARAYPDEYLKLSANYLLPKPLDPRLILEIAPAVAKAAMDSGVATRPITDFAAYRDKLATFVFRSGALMGPVFVRAKRAARRVVFAEGEDVRVLRAARAMLSEGLGRPILVGRPTVIARRAEEAALAPDMLEAIEVVNPERDKRYRDYWQTYHKLMERRGVSPEVARTVVRTNSTVIAALSLYRGEADAMICGSYGRYDFHLRHVLDVIGLEDGVTAAAALSVLIMPKGSFFLCDTFVGADPTAQEIVQATLLAAKQVRHFGLSPKVALLSHSDFGASPAPSAHKMREALSMLHAAAPELEAEGEMSGEVAIDPALRHQLFPNSRLAGAANLLIMPTMEAANIAYSLLKALGDGLPIGPILLGTAKPAHIVTPTVTARGLLNIAAVAAAGAQESSAD